MVTRLKTGCRTGAVLLSLAFGASAGAHAAAPSDVVLAQPRDPACLRWLDERRIRYVSAPPAGAMKTPVKLAGAVGSLTLAPRGRRGAILMDCELARALWEAQPIFAETGISLLGFSAAYNYRTRRDSSRLSGHAYGLAIDVHVLRGRFGEYDVAKDFEAGVGEWLGLAPRAGALAACIGTPKTARGRDLRTLVCRLKLHPAFRVIVTPDDNRDHRDHIHIEAFPDAQARAHRRPAGTKAKGKLRSRRAR